MVRFFLNSQVFNNPADWEGFSTQFKRDYDKRIISVQYTDRITFSGAAHTYIQGVQQADGYCAEIDLRIEEQCGNGPWNVMARGKVIMADCEWNETKCTVQCSVVDNGIGARVANNKKVPVSPLSDLSKNNVSITPVPPIDLTMFNTAGADISGTRRVFDWFLCMEQALAYITDGSVTITSDWYANLPDDEKYAVAVVPELRTAGFNVPRIAWTFDDLFTELSKKHNLWLFATEDSAGSAKLILEPEPYFLGTSVSNTVLNIEDLIRKTDIERLYATVDVGSEDGIVELLVDNPLPFVVLLGFSKETFHFKGVCNTDASLDLVNKWIIDTNVIYQIVEQGNEDFDKNFAIVQYTASTSRATMGTYLFIGATPYLYNEQLLNSNVLPRFPLPSSVGVNYAPGIDDRFRAEHLYSSNSHADWEVSISFIYTPLEYQIGFGNDWDSPNFDTNNTWGNGTAPFAPVTTANSLFTPTAQGVFVFNLNLVWSILGTYPNPNALNTYSEYRGCYITVKVKIYNSSDIEIGSYVFGTTPTQWVVGTYTDSFSVPVSLSVGDYVKFFAQGYNGAKAYNYDLGAPVGPTPPTLSPAPGGRCIFNVSFGSYVETETVISGGVAVPTIASSTLTFSFSRFVSSGEWLAMIQDPGAGVMIDGARLVHALDMRRKITGETQFEMIKQP